MYNVLVLMSSYNGEDYIEDQIKSIFDQKGVNVHLYIRDDGSTDSTLQIINDLSSQYDIKLREGTNIGAKHSFMHLLFFLRNEYSKYDYFAFADQDDIWLEDKMFAAISKIENKCIPALYCSRVEVVDKNLRKIDNSFNRNLFISFETAIMGRAANGCTVVFNKALYEKVLLHYPLNMRMHDHWLLLVCLSCGGHVYYDERSYIKYRQHENNVVGGNTSVKEYLVKYTRSFWGKPERLMQAKELYYSYGKYMSADIKKTIKKVVKYNSSIKNRMSLAFDNAFRTHTYRDFLFIIAVLLGRF